MNLKIFNPVKMELLLILKNTSTILIFLLSLCSCENDENIRDLNDIFSCTIQGESFFPKKSVSPFIINFLSIGKENNSFYLEAMNNSKRYMRIRIDIHTGNEPIQEKEYILKRVDFNNFEKYPNANAACYFQRGGGSEIQLVDESSYHTSDDHLGSVTITKIDTINKNIQGNFKFQAINKFNEMIAIDNGKFNVNYLD
ncbi:MAG: Uncharacterised protein [Polaribacter sejongensis]|nr:MAG: Uncharacterised protein [Polaribacter sejongensis]